jgi:hypothetical protein
LRSWWALPLLLGLAICSQPVVGQSSTPKSTDTAQPSPPTTPTDAFVSMTLRPLVEQALIQSEASDQTLTATQQQIEQDRQQRIADDKQRQIESEQRQSEQQASATALQTLSDKVAALQTYSDGLLQQLTSFSASEAKKQAAEQIAIDKIRADAKALEVRAGMLRVGLFVAVPVAASGIIYALGHFLLHWK